MLRLLIPLGNNLPKLIELLNIQTRMGLPGYFSSPFSDPTTIYFRPGTVSITVTVGGGQVRVTQAVEETLVKGLIGVKGSSIAISGDIDDQYVCATSSIHHRFCSLIPQLI